MKITLSGLNYPFRGGITHYSSILAQKLRERHDLQFISFKRLYPGFLFPGTTQLDRSREKIAAPSLPLLDSLNPASWARAFSHIRAFQPDLIVLQWWHPITAFSYAAISLLCKISLDARVIFLCHNIFPHEPFPLSGMMTRMGLRCADGFIAHAAADFDTLRGLFPQKGIIHAYHPIYQVFRDEAIDRASARRFLSLGPEERMVLFFGIIRKYKGVKYLLEAIPQVVQEIPCKFFIVGESYQGKEAYLEQIERANLGKHITWVNRYIPNEEVGHYFNACDVVVLPYEEASQSGIAQIALAFDRPVIATQVGGLSEVVEPGVTGYLVRPRDPPALAQAILTFYREGRQREFQENIRRAQARFSWEGLARAVEQSRDPTAAPSRRPDTGQG